MGGASPSDVAATDAPGAIETVFAQGEDVVFSEAAITEEATFFDYDAGGTTVELFAVRAPDGSIRTALNTCQSCNGSPAAYFVQEGDEFVCQNCNNRFDVDAIGLEHTHGCNPVPITEDERDEQEDAIVIPAGLLDGYADIFENWKVGL